MRLTVVGCSGSFPGPESAASCYLVEAEGVRMLLDLGNGALGALAKHVDIYGIDAVLLSHLHPDHCLDLCSYYVARTYRPTGPPLRIPVFGPAGTADRLARAYGDPRPDAAMLGTFDFRSWLPGAYEVGPFRVDVDRVDHPVETFGMRVSHGGRVLAYSADTGPCEPLTGLAREADLFLCEASFREGRDDAPGLHLTGRQAAQHARRAGAGRLLLTHVPPWNNPQRTLEESAPAYDGPTDLARPGETYDI